MPVDINVNCDFSDCIHYDKCVNGGMDQHTKFLIYSNLLDKNQYFMPKIIIKNNSWVACKSHVESEDVK